MGLEHKGQGSQEEGKQGAGDKGSKGKEYEGALDCASNSLPWGALDQPQEPKVGSRALGASRSFLSLPLASLEPAPLAPSSPCLRLAGKVDRGEGARRVRDKG